MSGEQQGRLQGLVSNYRPIDDLIPPHWSDGMVFANGIHHHYYRTGGEKPPLLLLHGFNENGLTWLRVAGLSVRSRRKDTMYPITAPVFLCLKDDEQMG